jgi:hypothetical protein
LDPLFLLYFLKGFSRGTLLYICRVGTG